MILTRNPEVFGASLIKPTIASLAEVDVDGLTIGTSCYVAETDSFFVMRPSDAVVDHTTVEAVLGYDGLRWVVQGEEGNFVDINVSGTANFDNPIVVDGVTQVAVDPGTIQTVSGSDVTNIDFTVDSANDGGWRGFWFMQADVSSDIDVTLQPGQSTASNALGGKIYGTEGSTTATVNLDTTNTTPPIATKLVLDRFGGNANRAKSYGKWEFWYKEGIGGFFTAWAMETTTTPSLTGGQIYAATTQIWTGSGAITSLRFNSSGATRIKVGSWISIQKMGFTG